MRITLIIEPGCLGQAAGITLSGKGPDGVHTIRIDPTRLPSQDLLMPVVEHEIAHVMASGDAYLGLHFMDYRKEIDR